MLLPVLPVLPRRCRNHAVVSSTKLPFNRLDAPAGRSSAPHRRHRRHMKKSSSSMRRPASIEPCADRICDWCSLRHLSASACKPRCNASLDDVGNVCGASRGASLELGVAFALLIGPILARALAANDERGAPTDRPPECPSSVKAVRNQYAWERWYGSAVTETQTSVSLDMISVTPTDQPSALQNRPGTTLTPPRCSRPRCSRPGRRGSSARTSRRLSLSHISRPLGAPRRHAHEGGLRMGPAAGTITL